MKLIFGGAYNGKLDFVKKQYNFLEEDIAFGDRCSMKEALNMPVVYGLNKFIKRLMLENNSPQAFFDNLIKLNPDVILITDDVGMGIVPMDGFERDYREMAGKIATLAAEKSETVLRIYYGLASVIKGEGY